jgi:hypothetical protein
MPRAESHGWFAVYDPRQLKLAGHSTYDCEGWLQEVKSHAAEIRGRMDKASEAARQSGVHPGTMRELLRKYRLEWDGWER